MLAKINAFHRFMKVKSMYSGTSTISDPSKIDIQTQPRSKTFVEKGKYQKNFFILRTHPDNDLSFFSSMLKVLGYAQITHIVLPKLVYYTLEFTLNAASDLCFISK